MYGHLTCLALAAFGVDVGWQRLPDGGLQYLIQIGPEMIDSLKAGAAIESDVPPTLKDIRGYRITLGKGELPRQTPPADPVKPAAPSMSDFNFSQPLAPPLAGGPPSSSPFPSSPSPNQFKPMPRTLMPEPSGKPLAEQTASFVQPSAPSAPIAAAATGTAAPATAEAAPTSTRAWSYLAGSLVALSGSLAWNGYLLWMLREARRRYRQLLDHGNEEDVDFEDEPRG